MLSGLRVAVRLMVRRVAFEGVAFEEVAGGATRLLTVRFCAVAV